MQRPDSDKLTLSNLTASVGSVPQIAASLQYLFGFLKLIVMTMPCFVLLHLAYKKYNYLYKYLFNKVGNTK